MSVCRCQEEITYSGKSLQEATCQEPSLKFHPFVLLPSARTEDTLSSPNMCATTRRNHREDSDAPFVVPESLKEAKWRDVSNFIIAYPNRGKVGRNLEQVSLRKGRRSSDTIPEEDQVSRRIRNESKGGRDFFSHTRKGHLGGHVASSETGTTSGHPRVTGPKGFASAALVRGRRWARARAGRTEEDGC